MFDGHAVRQSWAEPCGFLLGGASNFNRVGDGLLDDADTHLGYSVAAKEAAVFSGRAFNAGNVAQPQQIAVIALRQHPLLEIFSA